MKLRIYCPHLNPKPFYAKFKSWILEFTKIAFIRFIPNLSPILQFYKFNDLKDKASPYEANKFVKLLIKLALRLFEATDND